MNQTGAHVKIDFSLIFYLSEWILMMVAYYDLKKKKSEIWRIYSMVSCLIYYCFDSFMTGNLWLEDFDGVSCLMRSFLLWHGWGARRVYASIWKQDTVVPFYIFYRKKCVFNLHDYFVYKINHSWLVQMHSAKGSTFELRGSPSVGLASDANKWRLYYWDAFL